MLLIFSFLLITGAAFSQDEKEVLDTQVEPPNEAVEVSEEIKKIPLIILKR